MSRRLTYTTRPSNQPWEDIVVVAEGSEVAGYSVTPEHFKKAKKMQRAIEALYGGKLQDFIRDYNYSKKAVLSFIKLENNLYKKFVNADCNQHFLKAIIDKAYRLVSGMSSSVHLTTRETSRFFNYEKYKRRSD